MRLLEYCAALRADVAEIMRFSAVVQAHLSIDERPNEQCFVKAIIVLTDGNRLHVREFVDCSSNEAEKLSYSYHAQNNESILLFRFDNAPHKPPLGYTEHLHESEGSITPAKAPSILQAFHKFLYISNII